MPISPETVDRALEIARRNPENFEYFFDRLTSPDWLEPLRERGLFTDPPPFELKDGYIRSPGWAPSRFLARMAAFAPEQVLRIALEIVTDNERVHEDLAEAARTMPGELAAVWADHEINWVRGREHLYFLAPDKLCKLAVHLAQSGLGDVGLELVAELFRPTGVDHPSTGPWDIANAVTRVESWQYDLLLKETFTPLLEASPELTLSAVVGLLGACLDLAQVDPDDPRNDYSYVWRTRISDDADRGGRDPEQGLVSELRDLAVAAHEKQLVSDAVLVEMLMVDPRPVFSRIAMYALTQGPAPDPAVAARLVLDRAALLSDHPSPEYQALLERAAPLLSDLEREELIGWIDAGPDIERFTKWMREGDDREPTEAEAREYGDRWRVKRFALVQAVLTEPQRHEYEALIERVGEQRFTPLYEVTSWSGHRSPFTLEELRQLDDEELIRVLTAWEEPDNGFGPGPSLEGLARALSELAEQEPARISRLAPQLRGLHAQMSYWTLIGLSAAGRKTAVIHWDSVFDLIDWLLAQDAVPPATEGDRDDERTIFGWIGKEIAALLEAGLVAETNPLPFDNRERVWAFLARLMEDPDPSLEREHRDSNGNLDAVMVGLNSTRGRALRAAISYGFWVRNALGLGTGADAHAVFEVMPELRDALEAHLDPDHDPSSGVRSVYGQFLPQLSNLDTEWVRGSVTRIFPEQPELSRLCDAAWGSYLVYSAPYNDLFEMLRPMYEQALDRLGEQTPGLRWIGSVESPDQRLSEHLMSYYWRGLITLNEDDLVQRLFVQAPAELRAHALGFLGRSAHHQLELTPEVTERVTAFWDDRFKQVGANENERVELQSFGSWLPADSLPLKWRLDQLERLLDAQIGPTPEFVVFEFLRQASEHEPARVMRLLRRYFDYVTNTWAIGGHTGEIEETLRIGLNSTDERANAEAVEAIHKLGALGYRNFRAMLVPPANI